MNVRAATALLTFMETVGDEPCFIMGLVVSICLEFATIKLMASAQPSSSRKDTASRPNSSGWVRVSIRALRRSSDLREAEVGAFPVEEGGMSASSMAAAERPVEWPIASNVRMARAK